MLYTEDENVTCYRCDQEEYNKIETKSSKFLEYMKLHKLSLIQDMEAIEDHEVTNEGYPKEYLQGAIACMDHLLSVATDIMNNSNERYINE
jgi:hypothetical protein